MSVETVDADEVDVADLLGSAVKRREDPALITGDAEYTDDIQYPRAAHMAILRSQYAHARIEAVHTDAAEARDDVLAVYTWDDVEASDSPGLMPPSVADYCESPDRPILARDRVRYQGEPVAAVVAEERYAAHDALDDVEVEYDRLEAVTDAREAAEDGAPGIHEGAPDNVAFEYEIGDEAAVEEAFDAADRVVDLEFVNNRLIPTAMEPRSAVARYTPSSRELSIELSIQKPHEHREELAEALGLPENKVRVRAPDVGGGFGSKIFRRGDETLTAWAAMQLGRPVKWTATRSEDVQSTTHGRDHVSKVELAVDDDGSVRGLRGEAYANLGGYAINSGPPTNFAQMLPGQYDIPSVYGRVVGTFTNTTPVAAYRGAGRPEGTYAIERVMGLAAKELGMDPTELRRKNFVPADDFPHETATGHVYDSGDYEKTLDLALETVDYGTFRERQREAREDGRYLGIGFSCFVESCGSAPGRPESGMVRFHPSGTVTAYVGTFDHGQGHHTTFAQVLANELGIDYDDVEVVDGDTDETPMGHGTSGSRSMAIGGSALVESARKVIEQARRVAADGLEADAEDVEFEDGEFRVAGAPERSVHIKEVAERIYAADDLPEGVEPGLEATSFYDPPNYTFPFGTHVAVVEVDPDTGEVGFERYLAVDDVGNRINPKIVEGQVVGGVAQGIGQALYESAEYDDNGNLVTGSLQDYVFPKAFHIPEIETEETVTPCPHNPLGVKGVGEAGTIAAPPAVVNAVVDALEPFGVDHLDMPITPENVWRAVEDAE